MSDSASPAVFVQEESRRPRKFVFPPPKKYRQILQVASPHAYSGLDSPTSDFLLAPEVSEQFKSRFHHADDFVGQVYQELVDIQLFWVVSLQRYTPKFIAKCLVFCHSIAHPDLVFLLLAMFHLAAWNGFSSVITTVDSGAALILSHILNGIMKNLFQEPRPYWISNLVKNTAQEFEPDFSFPSIRCQSSAAMSSFLWFFLVASPQYDQKVFWIFQAMLVFTILGGIARIILGHQYPLDVVFGWFFGLVSVFVFHFIFPLGSNLHRIAQFNAIVAFALCLAVPLLLAAVSGLQSICIPIDSDLSGVYQKVASRSLFPTRRCKVRHTSWADADIYFGSLLGGLFSVALDADPQWRVWRISLGEWELQVAAVGVLMLATGVMYAVRNPWLRMGTVGILTVWTLLLGPAVTDIAFK